MRARLVLIGVGLAGLVGLAFYCRAASDAPKSTTTALTVATADTPESRTFALDPTRAAGTPSPSVSNFAAELVARLGQEPRRPTPEQARVAVKIGELFNAFDLEAAAELYKDPSIGMEEWFLWLRARLGECEDGRPMVVVDASRARYIYRCEHGHLEAEFAVDPDTGKLPGLIMGARDVDLDEAVREAAEAVMRLFAAWDLALFHRTFNDKFDAEEIRHFLLDVRAENGNCTLGQPDLVSARGALINLDCERAPRMMKIELGSDDRIRTLLIRAPRREL